MAKKEKVEELSIDEHNKAISDEIAKLEAGIEELKGKFRSEAEKKQATLEEFNAMFNKLGKK